MPTNVADQSDLAILSGSDQDFRSRTMYFLILDRFSIGNPDKAREADDLFDPSQKDWNLYWGGDLQGLIDKLDYLKSFGISAIWTTPLFEQVESVREGGEAKAPIHGYWTSDFKRINARWLNDPSEKRLFTRDDTVFDQLLKNMHDRDMKYVLDVVCNHSSPESKDGKGKLYDDGELIADFENDKDHWYHHYGEVLDWDDEWQVQHGELAGLATFNENNTLFRKHIKESIGLWIQKGVDALRIDTVKHMPLWFWQEFNADMTRVNPALFRFGEWLGSHPEDENVVELANRSGMTILDFAFCGAIRECLATDHPDGFRCIQRVLDLDGNYAGATEMVTVFENHDMARFQSLGASDRALEMALILLLTSRGVPCLYYGCEQYLHNDMEGGEDPYNRPMMENWDETEATRIIRILAAERAGNQAIQWGGQWPKWVDEETYVFLRRYRGARCLVFLNKGGERELTVENLEFPDGDHECLLTKQTLHIEDGKVTLTLPDHGAFVIAVRGDALESKAIISLQLNGAPVKPGDRLCIIGDCDELGEWDLARGFELECINSNTWFGEVPFDASCGKAIGYKYVVFSAEENKVPLRENCTVRRRLVVPEGKAKWRDQWEE